MVIDTITAQTVERVVAVGIDTAGAHDVEAGLSSFGDAYVRRVASPVEAALLPTHPRRRVEALTTLWAAKEAVSKTLSPAADDVWRWPDIEVDLREPGGAVRLHGRPRELAEQLGVERVVVTAAQTDGVSSTVVAIALGSIVRTLPQKDSHDH